MGMYTEIYVNVNLKSDTPEEVIGVLEAICLGQNDGLLKDYPDRWKCLFSDMSFYTPSTSCAKMKYQMGFWSLLGKGDIKNYDNEIEKFFEYIMSYVDASEGEFIGYKRYEEAQVPTLIFKEKE